MSNIEIVQKAYEAFGAGDMEKLASLMSDDYVAILPEGSLMEGPLKAQMNLSRIV